MIYENICAHCGKKFTSNRELTQYCSADCRTAARKKYQYEWNKAKRARVSNQRKDDRSKLSAARSAEIEERSQRSKEAFEKRCADGDSHALMLREKAEHGNMSRRYWELFKQCCIEDGYSVVVNGHSVYDDLFVDNVMRSIADGNAICITNR